MTNQNCWEYWRCGREPGGKNVRSLGICPAAIDEEADGLNHGKNGGRICWAIVGTHCEGDLFNSPLRREQVCTDCGFYQKVKSEEGFLEYTLLKPGQLK